MKLYAVEHFVTDEVKFFVTEYLVERFLKKEKERGESNWFRVKDKDLEY